MERDGPIVCVGGANVDKKLYAKNEIAFNTSNPVTSSVSVGGVSRNIAENLGRLGNEVVLLSGRGEDTDWKAIADASASFMDLSRVKESSRASTGSYTAVLDPRGDLSCAYADMDIFDELTVSYLEKNEDVLLRARCIIADLNCPAATILYLKDFSEDNDIPFVVIPVSSPKMERLLEPLEGIDWLIVNKDESETFHSMSIRNEEDWRDAVNKWLDKGVRHVVVTGGGEGVIAGSEEGITHFPSLSAKVVDVTGAGDSFCGAVLHSWLQGESMEEAIHHGQANARKTIMSKTTVREDLTHNQLKKDREENEDGKVS